MEPPAPNPNLCLTADQLSLLGEYSVLTGKTPEAVLNDALLNYKPSQSPAPEAEQLSFSERMFGALLRSRLSLACSKESFGERLAEKGLLGCLAGGPSDLSANPAYMEGFGGCDH